MNKPLALLLSMSFIAASAFADTQTATLDVSRMDCAACPITVRKALEKVPGVESAKVDYRTKRAVVAFDPAKATTQTLTEATADAGYPSSLRQVR